MQLGVRLGQLAFTLARPLAFALHARPLNTVRREHGLPALGHDLRHSYTWGDHTLYADIPELFTTQALPPNHHFLGPILWSPTVPEPEWWSALPSERPIVYVTLGSSGRSDLSARAPWPISRRETRTGLTSPTEKGGKL